MRLRFAHVLCALLFGAALQGQALAQRKAEAKPAGAAAERRVMESGTDRFGLSQIGQVAVSVGDLERATAFYRDKLGMKYLFAADGMAFFDCDGIRLMLARLSGAATAPSGHVVYFKVRDIQESYKVLSGRGVRFEERPELAARTEKFELWLACFKDSENNDLCLMSEVPPK